MNEKIKQTILYLMKTVQNLDELGLNRYCCRAIMLGHVDLIDTVSRFKKF